MNGLTNEVTRRTVGHRAVHAYLRTERLGQSRLCVPTRPV